MIVTIDGPAGAGKTSAARKLAQRLGFRFLDTGAMYRAVTWAGLERRVDWNRPEALVQLTGQLSIQCQGDRVLVDGRDITDDIRSLEITSLSRYAAGNQGVRVLLVELQRQVAAGGNVVTEGRDQGTVVFPQAECKIFLTASAEERARRRYRELKSRGDTVTYEEVLAGQQQRDRRDSTRRTGPLVKADDAVEVLTDGLELEEVVDLLERLVRERMTKDKGPRTNE